MSSNINLPEPAIPRGSLVLVTGVNGLIGSHVVDQFLAAGYNVRGTVRDTNAHGWLTEFFDLRYSPGRFQLWEVKDFTKPGCFDSAVEGVMAVAHTASHIDMSATEPEPTISIAIQTVITALESAAKADSVKRFVLTSSAWAAAYPSTKLEYKVDAQTWNNQILQTVQDKTKQHNGLEIFMAAKTLVEKRAWEWVEQHKPDFGFATVLPDVVLGPVLCPEHQGIPSTAGLVQRLYEGKSDFLSFVEPQWFVDVIDIGKLHVAACVDTTVKAERILGYGERFNWDDVLAVFRKAFPKGKFIADLNLLKDLGQVDNSRGEELLRKIWGTGWTTLEESILGNVNSFVDVKAVPSNG